MDISPYFIEIIADKDQVIVPGLGKFYKKRSSGYYDDETKTYYPPSGEIDFSSDYMHDDKLVHLISQKNNTSLTAAYAILDEYIRDLKTLIKTETVNIVGIGNLELENGIYTLKSKRKPELNKAFFGLPAIDTQSESLIGDETYSLAQQALNTSMPDDIFKQEENKKSGLKIALATFAIIILASLIGLYFVRPEIYKNLINEITLATSKINTLAPIPSPKKLTPNEQALQKADSIYDSNDIESKLKSQGFEVEKVKDSTNVLVKQKAIPTKGGFRYEIVIGLYLNKKEAQERVTQLKSYGIDAHILDDKDGPMVKISGATLYNDAEAEKELKRIREELNPEAFKKTYKILK